MRVKHAFTILFVAFMVFAPLTAAAMQDNFAVAQEEEFNPEELIGRLLEEGAEVLLTNIDDDGVPGVIYGQLGIPSGDLGLEEDFYDGCLAMAMISTHGEFLDIVFDLIGADIFSGDSSGGEFTTAQDGGIGSPEEILEILGTEFNLLITVYANMPEAESQQKMSNVVTHMTNTFGFSLAQLLTLRIDENLFPPEAEIELPFDSLDLFIYQELSTFDIVTNAMLGQMDDSGILGAMDTSLFTEARASAAGMLAIPDLAELVNFINSTFEGAGTSPPSSGFTLSQFPGDLEGPLAIAAVGYLGEQVLTSESTELDVGGLVGATGTISPLDSGQSIILTNLPENVNITSVTPFVENQTFYEANGSTVLWNSTALGDQPEYVVSFDGGEFPPPITIERTFSPATATAGGSVEVTVTVTNEGTEAISDVHLNDTGILSYYSSITVTGTTSDTFATLNGGQSESITYQVAFENEGRYGFPKAAVMYTYDGDIYTKTTSRDGYTVEPNPGNLAAQAIADGWPYSGIAIGVVALVGIYSIAGLVRGRGDTYQV
jgi:hypothetical protein